MSISHVLITRPEPQASELAALLEPLGIEAVLSPAFEFLPASEPVRLRRAWRESRSRLAVFTSPRAVRFGLEAVPAAELSGARIAAVGPATARALESADLQPLCPEQGYTSEALLEHPDLRRAPGCALIFAAPGGRAALRIGLERLGWHVQMLPVYRRVAVAPGAAVSRALAAAPSPASVWTSGNAMEVVLDGLEPAARSRLLTAPFVVVSERLADIARALGAAHVSVATGPDNDSLAAALTGKAR